MTPREYEKTVARFLLRRLRGKKRSIEGRGGPAFIDTTGKLNDPTPTFYPDPNLGNPIKWTEPDPGGGPNVGSGGPIKWTQPDPPGGPGVGSGNPNQWVPPNNPGGPKVGSGNPNQWVPPNNPGGPKVGSNLPNQWVPPDPGGGPIVVIGGPPVKVVYDKDPKPGPLAPTQWVPPFVPGGPAAGLSQAPWTQWVVTDGQGGDGDAAFYNELFVQRRAFWDYTDGFAADTIADGIWSPQIGTWGIAAAVLSLSAFGASQPRGLSIYSRQQSYRDVKISAIVKSPTASTQHAVAARMTLSGGQWSGYVAVARTNTYTIRRCDAGVFTTIATVTRTAVADGDTITLDVRGDQLTFTAPGIAGSLTATDATYTYGAVGQAAAASAVTDFATTIITDRPT